MRLLSALVSLALAAPALASTYVVDDSGGVGVDFTSISAAVAVAQPGDILVVLAGTYSGFTLQVPIALLAETGLVTVTGAVHVQNIPSATRAALVGLTLPYLDVTACSGSVFLESVAISNGQIVVTSSTDVRLRAVSVHAQNGFNTTNPSSLLIDGQSAVVVNSSRVEIVESTLTGGNGGNCIPCSEDSGTGGYGGHGLVVSPQSEAHVARSTLQGGAGGNASPGFLVVGAYGGGGGHGIFDSGFPAAAGGGILVTGNSTHVLQGGPGGTGPDGNGSTGLGVRDFSSNGVRASGASIQGLQASGPVETPPLADPIMNQIDTPMPGGPLTFRISATPGSSVDLVFGRKPALVASGTLSEDILLQRNRILHLGIVDATGVKSVNFTTPSFLPIGYTFVAQAEVLYPDATLRRTHSIPLILR